jgi:hypothetical protein
MECRKAILTALLLLVGSSLFPTTIHPQDQENDTPPKPAARALPLIGLGDDQEANQTPDLLEPDNRPLTGFQQQTLGTTPERHSYWIPGFSCINLIQSNDLAQGGGSTWGSISYVTGNLSLLQKWSGGAQLALNYSGGGSFSSDPKLGNGQFQQLGVTQTFNWRRLQLTILDRFWHLPQSQFGLGAGTTLMDPGITGPLAPTQPDLLNQFTPNQSIFTAFGPQSNNVFGTQISYRLTSRASLTFGGVFGILRFSEPGNIDSNEVVASAGYNYQVTANDALGLSYLFNAYHYIDSPQAIGDHVLQAHYGKKITGRLALALSGGAALSNFRVPLGADAKTQYLFGTASASLSYRFSAGTIGLDYLHGLNGGSGVFLGATSDQITGGATRRLSRVWTGHAGLGFARNKIVTSPTAGQNSVYDTLYVGAGLARPLGRSTNFTLNYTADIQTSNGTVCAGPNCATNFTTHVISVGLSWHARPFVLH